jgi:CheY-like chemotaxis protein
MIASRRPGAEMPDHVVPAAGQTRIIQIVEDDADDAFILQRCLKGQADQLGLELDIVVSSNGQVALRDLEDHLPAGRLPDLAIVDLNMPVMDGIAFMRRVALHADFHPIPIIVLTTASDPQSLQEAVAAGARDALSKPTSLGDLKSLCRDLLSELAD